MEQSLDPKSRYTVLAEALTASFLAIDGVRAVGGDADGLTVYVRPDDPAVLNSVEELVRLHDPTAPIHFVPTDEFRAF
jgi:hypothetical protein